MKECPCKSCKDTPKWNECYKKGPCKEMKDWLDDYHKKDGRIVRIIE